MKDIPNPETTLMTRQEKMENALRSVLLFHRGSWDAEEAEEWKIRTGGKYEASTRGLCDFIRSVLGDDPKGVP